MKDNREEYERLSRLFIIPVSETLCHAAARIELVISNLTEQLNTTDADINRPDICLSASSLFYAIVPMLSNDTNTYLPINQFLNSCVETLGTVGYIRLC